MYLYGASGHAKVIIDILTCERVEISGVFDDDINKKEICGYRVLSVPQDIEMLNDRFIISIGDNNTRKLLSEKYTLQYLTAIHPSSIISNGVSIGHGTVIMPNTAINASTSIGKHVIINTSASVDHDCIIENYAHISPAACLCGDVNIGTGTHIGAGAVVLPGVSIGKWSVIGSGSVVLNDIPDLSVAVGNPARIIRELNK